MALRGRQKKMERGGEEEDKERERDQKQLCPHEHLYIILHDQNDENYCVDQARSAVVQRQTGKITET